MSDSDQWTGNEHLLCSVCGKHDRLRTNTVGVLFLCGDCVLTLVDTIRWFRRTREDLQTGPVT